MHATVRPTHMYPTHMPVHTVTHIHTCTFIGRTNRHYYSFSKPNVCFTCLQTTEQRAIMNSAGLQIHLQTHGSQANGSKHNQLTNKIVLFSRQAALYIYLVLQDNERNLGVLKSQLCSCFWWAVVIRSLQDKLNFRNEFQHGNFFIVVVVKTLTLVRST